MVDQGNNIRWVPGLTIEEAEKQCILQAFRWFRSNKTQTAQALGISIRTLEHKLEKYQSDQVTADERRDQDRRDKANTLARMRGVAEPYPGGSEPQGSSEKDSESAKKAPIGVRLQPPVEAQSQHEMPVPKRREVQTVLPNQASPVRHAKRS